MVQYPTPGPAKANLPVQDEKLGMCTPGHALLSSLVRKTVWGRHSYGPVFKTPDTFNNHWEVMEIDVIAPVAPDTQGEEVQSEDYDKIEYMSPTAEGASATLLLFTVSHYTNAQCRSAIRTALRCA